MYMTKFTKSQMTIFTLLSVYFVGLTSHRRYLSVLVVSRQLGQIHKSDNVHKVVKGNILCSEQEGAMGAGFR